MDGDPERAIAFVAFAHAREAGSVPTDGKPSRRSVARAPSRDGSNDGYDAFLGSVIELTSALHNEEALTSTLQRVVDLAYRAITACDLASVTYMAEGRPFTIVTTDAVAETIDQAQYDADTGPCLDAFREKRTVSVPEMRTEQRWAKFRDRAIQCGVESSFSLPLIATDVGVGALNLYSRTKAGFIDVPGDAASLFAKQAGVAVANARLYERARNVIENLEAALDSRDLIGQAKGIVMANEKVTGDEAFAILKKVSQNRNVKLRGVAVEVIETGLTPQ
jgi:transcriptional regulator with GAF, ATPase, and Fis domain